MKKGSVTMRVTLKEGKTYNAEFSARTDNINLRMLLDSWCRAEFGQCRLEDITKVRNKEIFTVNIASVGWIIFNVKIAE